MDFENELTSKILDPIHGTIRLTTLEIAFINHPLFQRLRNIKQNSFLYKVFPSAVHSRFEHSLGVLHLSSEILNNLRLNAIRYQKKYDDGHVFGHIDQIPKHNIQELRLAALMHDIGHGPVSHQFESFMPCKHEFSDVLPTAYHSIIDVLSKPEQKVEHEQLSLLFSLMIYHDLRKQGKVDDEINIENVLKILEYPAVNDLDHLFLSDRCRPDGLLAQRWLFLRRQVWHLRLQSLVYVNCPGRGTGKIVPCLQREWD